MKIERVIQLSGLIERGNVLPEELAIEFLSELDGMIMSDIMLYAPEEIVRYDSTDQDLILRPPHDGLYVSYLVAMIRQCQGEFEGYNNAQEIVEDKLKTFRRWYIHHYRPADTNSRSYTGGTSGDGFGFAYLTAYGLAVKHGYQGTEEEWLESLHGQKGDTGEAARMRYDAQRDMIQWGVGDEWHDLYTMAEVLAPLYAKLEELTGRAETAAMNAQTSERAAREAVHLAETAAMNAEAAAKRAEDAAGSVGSGGGASSWDELSGKPFYIHEGPNIVEWDGISEGMETFQARDSTGVSTYARISALVPEPEELIGGQLTVTQTELGQEPRQVAITAELLDEATGCYGIAWEPILVVQELQIKANTGRSGTAPATGIYVDLAMVGAETVRLEYGTRAQEKILPDRLPDGGFGWEGPGGETEIVPELKLADAIQTETQPMPDGQTLTGYVFQLTDRPADLGAASEWTVTIDGAPQKKQAGSYQAGDEAVRYAGNMSLLDTTAENTGEDWMVYLLEAGQGVYAVMFATTNSAYTSFSVHAQGTVFHKIHRRYLPEGMAEQDDLTWGNLQDKPFELREEVIASRLTLEEGGYNGVYTTFMAFPPAQFVAGDRYRVSVNGETQEWIAAAVDGYTYVGTDPAVLLGSSGELPDGLYSLRSGVGGMLAIFSGEAVAPVVGLSHLVIRPIDEQLIPDSIPRRSDISGAKPGQIARIKAVDENGVPTEWEPVEMPGGDGTDSGENVNQMEPAEDDIPKVFFGGSLQQTKDEAVVPFCYISKTQDIPGYAEIKAQGNSSMNYPKKNQTVKMFKDAECTEKLKVDFKGWGKQNKHVYKANWIDLTHARNVVSARLWADVVKSRANYVELPELFRTTPNQGAVDGFPVKVYAAGVYQGRYTLNIPKDKWTFNMDDELDNHCVLCGENYVSGCFRAAANIDGSDWTDEIHDTVPASIKTRWNEVISFVMNSTDDEFRANLSQYFYVDSLIDYYLFGLASCGLDAFGKNQIYATYDGQKWIASMYDMDSTWGLYWNGSKIVSASYGRDEYEDYVNSTGNLLYVRLEQLFWSELQTRWAELRSGALSIENIINRFERFTDIAPYELVKEDYASTTGDGKFTGIPSQTTNNIQQIRSFALARQAWTDTYVAGLTPVVPVPCTSITLDKAVLTFDAAGTQTLTATVTPEDTTDAVLWSSDNAGVASVSNAGVVTAVSNGTATITATCGAKSATCSVTVEGIGAMEPVYSLAEATTFDGTNHVDTGVKLYDTAKDWTILLEADLTQGSTGKMTVLHCINEVSPWPGVCLETAASFTDPASGSYVVGGAGASGLSNVYVSFPATATKVAIRCVGGNINTVAYLNNGDATSVPYARTTYAAYDGNLLLGCYQNTSGQKGRHWKGTIIQCDVYFVALSDERINEFLTAE